MTIQRLYYSNPITQEYVSRVLSAATARNQKPTLVILPLGCNLEIEAIDGVQVVVDKRAKPAPTHFLVEME